MCGSLQVTQCALRYVTHNIVQLPHCSSQSMTRVSSFNRAASNVPRMHAWQQLLHHAHQAANL
jgi:hypothetical protein